MTLGQFWPKNSYVDHIDLLFQTHIITSKIISKFVELDQTSQYKKVSLQGQLTYCDNNKKSIDGVRICRNTVIINNTYDIHLLVIYLYLP